jgi:methylmalonyl-CoA/ethylmalonyl-CoA epimerase
MEKYFQCITQVAMVVKDRDATVARYREIMGLEPFLLCSTPQLPGRKFHGIEEDFEVKAAVYHLKNGVDLEVLEPNKGHSLWQEFLDQHGDGLHHLMFDIDDLDEFERYMASKGIGVAQSGPSQEAGKRWVYFDSYEKLGFYVEAKSKGKEPRK